MASGCTLNPLTPYVVNDRLGAEAYCDNYESSFQRSCRADCEVEVERCQQCCFAALAQNETFRKECLQRADIVAGWGRSADRSVCRAR